jgi:phage baseplate assembly protein W
MSKYTYSDLNLNFYKHPNTKDVAKRYDFDAVKTSVLHILKSNTGDKLFNRNFGANLRELLFEPITPFFAIVIRNKVIEIIQKEEPRVNVDDVVVTPNETLNEVAIAVQISLKEFPEVSGTVVATLQRVR